MQISKREAFIKNTLFNSSFNLLNQLIAFFILPLFIKNIGAEIYGIWAISTVTLGYMGLIDLGFSEGVMRYISGAYINKNFENLNKAVNTYIVLLFGMGTCILLIILLFYKNIIGFFSIEPQNLETAYNLLLVAGLFSPFVWLTKITATTFKGILRFKEYSWLSSLQSLGGTLTMLYLVFNNYDIVSIAIITNIVTLVLWTPSIFVLLKLLPKLSFGKSYFSFSLIKETMPFSISVFYSQLISMLALQTDKLIIGIALSMQAVTAYTVASTLFYVTYSLMGMFSGVLQPTAYQAFASKDTLLIEKILAQGTKYMTMLYTPIGYLGVIISPLFIETGMGKDYLQYAVWSQAFMAVFVLTSGFGIPVNMVFNSGNTRPPNIFKTLSILINIIISIVLVNFIGIGGPILGTLIAGLLSILTFPYFCNLLSIQWKKHMLLTFKIILINIPSSILFHWLSLFLQPNFINVIWLSVLIIFVHFFTIYFTFFTPTEKNDLNTFLKMIGLLKSKKKTVNGQL